MHERQGANGGDLEAAAAATVDGSSSLALLVVDDDSNCLHASPDACRILGVEREHALAASLIDLLAVSERKRFTHVWHAFREQGGHAGPFRVDKTGLRIDVRVTTDVLPSRHLVVLSPTVDRAAGAPGREPERRLDRSSMEGVARPAIRRRGVHAPSERERQVLSMVATGATDEEIARRLELSPATVRTHVRNAKTKLGAQTRAQAVALALGRRIIEAD
ncbi:MAG TPA: LuxR C-terminal-related transcriptional regulator [Solirubrobacterales bacterium]|nr:LuxR C-terminal-related transcriptional regulator [Solirubrobacterales bacterium]